MYKSATPQMLLLVIQQGTKNKKQFNKNKWNTISGK